MPCVDLAVNVDVFPKPNGGTGVRDMSWQGGGKVASGMVACARLGAKCAMMGAVGSDDYGQFCIRDFERHGIDVSGMKVREGETTSLSIVISDRETNGRTIVYRRGTAQPPTFEELDQEILEDCQWFFISHVTAVSLEAMRRAKAAGAGVIVDADSYSSEMMENIGLIDVFIGSEFFYHALFRDLEYEKNCRFLCEKGPSIVIFTLATLLKWGMGLTSYGDVFNLINSTIAVPVMFLGSSPWAVVVYFILCNLLFFFGVHPSVLMSVYMPVVSTCALANVEAYLAGQPLPYLPFIVMFSVGSVDALGMELALLTAKSERYKTLSKVALVPAIFNISEPIIFGTPVAMNPYMFIPYILLKPVACAVAAIGLLLGLGNAYNPTVNMPFVVPLPITDFFIGGPGLVVIVCAAILAVALLFIPFVKMADKEALEEEAAAKASAE